MGQVELGHRLRAAREARELSYRDLREATGLALSHLQRLERGVVAEPAPSTLRALSRALGVSYEELMAAAGYL
jgi:transcriptional regulator with XRE-family HTH domain